MEEEPQYKFLQSIDPTKINIPIRDRFAKLTLSSNKKKQQAKERQEKENLTERELEKRKSVSRSLTQQLNQQRDDNALTDDLPRSTKVHPLLLSDSSSTVDSEFPSGYDEETMLTEGDFSDGNINDFDNVLERQVEALSQKISSLAVTAPTLGTNHLQPVVVKTESVIDVSSASISLKSYDDDEEEDDDEAITISDTSLQEDCPVQPAGLCAFDLMRTSDICLSVGAGTDEPFLPSTFSNDKADRMEAFLHDVSRQHREAQASDGRESIESVPHLTETQSGVIAVDSLDERSKQAHQLAAADTLSMSLDGEPIEPLYERTKKTDERQNRLGAFDETSDMSQPHLSFFGSNRRGETPPRRTSTDDLGKRLAQNDTEANTLTETQAWCNSSNDSSMYSASNLTPVEVEESVVIAETDESGTLEESVEPAEKASTCSNSPAVVQSEDLVPSNEFPPKSDDDSVDSGSEEITTSQLPIMGGTSINISAKINIKIQISQIYEDDESSSSAGDRSCSGQNSTRPDESPNRSSLPITENGEEEEGAETAKVTDGGTKAEQNKISAVHQKQIQKVAVLAKNHSNVHEDKQSNYNENNEEIQSDDEPRRNSSSTEEDKIKDNNSPGAGNVAPHREQADEHDHHMMTHAEKLLTQLYGSDWRTPEVLRTLKRTTAISTVPKFTMQSSNKKPTALSATKVSRSKKKTTEQESLLEDFSIFRSEIAAIATLDSTRLPAPTTPIAGAGKALKYDRHARTEPRQRREEPTDNIVKPKKTCNTFKVPQTEFKRRPRGATTRPKVESWRNLVDSDSDSAEGDNASDDPDADETKCGSERDPLWQEENSCDSDSDYEIADTSKKRAPLNRTKQNKSGGRSTTSRRAPNKSKDKLVYLDLTKDEVTILEGTPPTSPLFSKDANFENRLADILRMCRAEDKPRLPATPKSGIVSKRKLFTAHFGDEDSSAPVTPVRPQTPTASGKPLAIPAAAADDDDALLDDAARIDSALIPKSFRALYDKRLGSVLKGGEPVFAITPPQAKKATPTAGRPKRDEHTPKMRPPKGEDGKMRLLDQVATTPNFKYGFLKSLDVCVSKSLCHPDALPYRENFRNKKEELADMLYDLYNRKLFDGGLNVPLMWNKKLSNTAGRCLNKKRLGSRTCVVELSEKVLTSADRLRCTLVHELCHAATWIFNGEGGHGNTWRAWACKANSVFPELPKIGVCHQYDIEYKYTYKCTLCSAKSHAHSKSKKVENIRCSYCHGAIEIFLNKKDKEGNILPTPVREPTGFAKFVKDNYKQYKKPDLKHADVMKLLSNEFAALKVAGKK